MSLQEKIDRVQRRLQGHYLRENDKGVVTSIPYNKNHCRERMWRLMERLAKLHNQQKITELQESRWKSPRVNGLTKSFGKS